MSALLVKSPIYHRFRSGNQNSWDGAAKQQYWFLLQDRVMKTRNFEACIRSSWHTYSALCGFGGQSQRFWMQYRVMWKEDFTVYSQAVKDFFKINPFMSFREQFLINCFWGVWSGSDPGRLLVRFGSDLDFVSGIGEKSRRNPEQTVFENAAFSGRKGRPFFHTFLFFLKKSSTACE